MNVTGFGQNSTSVNHKATITIHSEISQYSATIQCLVVKNITSAIPTFSFNENFIKIPNHIKLSDPCYNKSQHVADRC